MNNQRYWTIIILTLIFLLVVTGITIKQIGITEDSIRLLVRWSAKAAGFLFAIAFGSSCMHVLIKQRITGLLVKRRADIGLAFGTVHLFHLSMLIWLQQTAFPVFSETDGIVLFGGGLAYFTQLVVIGCLLYLQDHILFKY